MIVVAIASLCVAALVPHHTARIASFCVFEVCVGLFWPSLGYLRARYVSEECRATTLSLFRVPLNVIVVVVLANIESMHERQVLMLCVAVLLPALACQWALVRHVAKEIEAGTGAAYAHVPVEGDEVQMEQIQCAPDTDADAHADADAEAAIAAH